MRGLCFKFAGLLCLALAIAPRSAQAVELPATRVFLNGTPGTVYFNDGDSFRVLSGPYKDSKARIGGFNTLESYGPVHSWGDWHAYELYINAKKATLAARRGVWHCFSELERDTYGRILWECPDLSVALIRQGLAHAMSVDEKMPPVAYIRAQRKAIAEKRGMWAHGVPAFVLTSLHSVEERPEYPTAYNRLVSTRFGHSEKWEHTEHYGECETICADEKSADPAAVEGMAAELRKDPKLAALLKDVFNIELSSWVDRYAREGVLPSTVEEGPLRTQLEAKLSAARAAGRLGQVSEQKGACVLYVTFLRRYGRNRPACLRGH